MGTAQNIYSLVVSTATQDIIVKIPNLEKMMEKTQLINIDLFTAHFQNQEELLQFCIKEGLVADIKEYGRVRIKCSRGKDLSVLYDNEKSILIFCARNETAINNTLEAENKLLKYFINVFIDHLIKYPSERSYLKAAGITYAIKSDSYNGSSNSYNKRKRDINYCINQLPTKKYHLQMATEENFPANERMELEIELDEEINMLINEHLTYRIVRDMNSFINKKKDKDTAFLFPYELEPLNSMPNELESTRNDINKIMKFLSEEDNSNRPKTISFKTPINVNEEIVEIKEPFYEEPIVTMYDVKSLLKQYTPLEISTMNLDSLAKDYIESLLNQDLNVTIDYNDSYQIKLEEVNNNEMNLDEFDYEGQSLGHVKRLGTNPSTGKNFNFSQTEE